MHVPDEVELDEAASAAALADALRCNAVFRIDGADHAGRLVGLSGKTMIIEVDDPGSSAVPVGDGAPYDVRFELRGDAFTFSAITESMQRSGVGCRIGLKQDSPVRVTQRRRFWRTPMKPSCRAALSTVRGRRVGNGAVLNVSRDGMACRIETAVAERLTIGDTLNAEFVLGDDSTPFCLAARIRAKTQGADSTVTILGLQFDWRAADGDAADRLERLTTCELAET